MRLLLLCLFTAFVSYAGGLTMLSFANPEVKFWNQVQNRSDTELGKIRKKQLDSPIVIFAGGSSCAFSIDSRIIEKQIGLPVMNYGVAATAGADFIIERAFARCQEGDLLVLALEPHFLTEKNRNKPTALGMSMKLAQGECPLIPGAILPENGWNFFDALKTLRPGPRYSVTWIAKSLRGDLRYRYDIDCYRRGGWLESFDIHTDLNPTSSVQGKSLSPEGRRLLKTVRQMAELKGIRVFYSLPWIFTEAAIADTARIQHARLLSEIAEIVPIIADPNLGVQTDISQFTDSVYHLNTVGAKSRSETVGVNLSSMISDR